MASRVTMSHVAIARPSPMSLSLENDSARMAQLREVLARINRKLGFSTAYGGQMPPARGHNRHRHHRHSRSRSRHHRHGHHHSHHRHHSRRRSRSRSPASGSRSGSDSGPSSDSSWDSDKDTVSKPQEP